MRKTRFNTTILIIGDSADFDSRRKLHRERRRIRGEGFDYKSVNYSELLKGKLPEIKTEKVIVFFFFPFDHWNRKIENRRYRGIYGNHTFYRKFRAFCERMVVVVKDKLQDKQLFFINDPLLSALYRDKLFVMDKLSLSGVPVPSLYSTMRVREVNHMLEAGHKFFVKPRCGSMGKGITYLQLGNWQTNFGYRGGRIISRRSDYGWNFRDITGNTKFLTSLFSKNIFMEEAIDSMIIKEDKVDFRVYTFMDKVLYVYPRRNRIDAVTTNISQGGKGDPALLDIVPERLLKKVNRVALKAAKVLGLNMTGIDVIIDSNLKNVYVMDVNMFPGFPKKRTFNLPRGMIKELKRLDRKGKIRYAKGSGIQL